MTKEEGKKEYDKLIRRHIAEIDERSRQLHELGIKTGLDGGYYKDIDKKYKKEFRELIAKIDKD